MTVYGSNRPPHSPELDLEFARSVLPYFRDPRYIRVDGKPMLIVYRPNVIPDLSATLLRWRELFREEGIGEVHLVSAMTFGYERGAEDGFRNSRRTGGVAGFSRKRKKPETESQAFDSLPGTQQTAREFFVAPPSHGCDACKIAATDIAGGIGG